MIVGLLTWIVTPLQGSVQHSIELSEQVVYLVSTRHGPQTAFTWGLAMVIKLMVL